MSRSRRRRRRRQCGFHHGARRICASAEVGYRAIASPSPGPVMSSLPGGKVVKSLGAKVC